MVFKHLGEVIMKKVWIIVNLYFARLLALSMIGGLVWGYNYIQDLNSSWFGYPTLCGIYFICICLTSVVLVLNVIATVIANKNINITEKKED